MKPARLLFQIYIGFATALLRQELEPYAPPPSGWTRVGSPHPSSDLELTLALRQSNVDKLEARLLQVSDPDHSDYGRHMSHGEVSALVAPHPSAVTTVRRWLLEHGARIHHDRSSPNGEFMVARLRLAAAERMLRTRYHNFEHARGPGRRVLRASRGYTVPSSIAPLLDFVSPGHSFSMLSPRIRAHGGGRDSDALPRKQPDAAVAREPKRRLRGDSAGGDNQEAGDGGEGDGDEGDGDDDGDDQPAGTDQPGRHDSWGASWGMPSKTRSGWPVWALGANAVSPAVVRSWFKLGRTHSKAAQSVSSRDAFKCVGLSGSAGAAADSWMQQNTRAAQQPATGVVFGQATVNFLRERTDLTHDLNEYFSAALPVLCRWNRLAVANTAHGPGGPIQWAGSKRQYEWDLPAVRRMASNGLSGVSVVTDSSVSNSALGPEAKRPTGEATMDVELILNTGAGVHTLVWGTAGHSPDPFTTQSNGEANEPWVKFMRQLAAAKCMPAVLSISYADNENSCTKPWARRGNIEFMKAGVRGVSIFVASGDGGVGGAWREPCKGRLLATWPAGSPYVTAVGATMRQVDVSPDSLRAQEHSGPGASYKSDEAVATQACKAGYTFFQAKLGASRGRPLCIKEAEWASSQSAGGFSYYFKRPAYQKAHVERYLRRMKKRSKLPVTRKYNWMYGRAYPDVSAFGENLLCNMHGRFQRGDGTSASTPLVAGVFAQLNDMRQRQGRPPLGFVNPFIYKNPQAFRDVVAGTNPGCGTTGFSAAPGWDAVTGMGSPNFEELAKAVKTLPK